MSFTLNSPAFRNGEAIPKKYTADGDNVPPPLAWSDAPTRTRSFALIVEDPDAPAGIFRHWGLYNIAGGRSMLPETVEQGAKTEPLGQAVNDFGHRRYDGPAPPKGHGAHHYHFRLAARCRRIARETRLNVSGLWNEARKHMIVETGLVGTYERRAPALERVLIEWNHSIDKNSL